MANDAINIMPNLKLKDAQMPIESFTGTKVASNPKHWHSFGCPAYILVQDLQSDTGHQPQMEIALASQHVLRMIATACKGCLPGAQLGNGTSIATVPCQAGLLLPNSEGERSLFTNLHMASHVQFCPTTNQDCPMGSGPQNRTNGWSAPNAAARGSATSCTCQQQAGTGPRGQRQPRHRPRTTGTSSIAKV